MIYNILSSTMERSAPHPQQQDDRRVTIKEVIHYYASSRLQQFYLLVSLVISFMLIPLIHELWDVYSS